MVKYPNVTLLLQGPVNNQNCLEFLTKLEEYSGLFGEIILSTYTEQIHLLPELANVKVVTCSNAPVNIVNDCNIYYQSLTTYNGLLHSTGKYTLKHRTDERYSNIHLMVDKFLLSDDKLLSTLTFIKPKEYPFLISDHLFIAKTEKLKSVFATTLANLFLGIGDRATNGKVGPELTYCQNFIRYHNDIADPAINVQLMRKHFEVISEQLLEPFTIRFNGHDNGPMTVWLYEFMPWWMTVLGAKNIENVWE